VRRQSPKADHQHGDDEATPRFEGHWVSISFHDFHLICPETISAHPLCFEVVPGNLLKEMQSVSCVSDATMR
jgi:hypothetical protein